MSHTIINLLYLLAAVLMALGIKGLAKPRTAVRANFTGAVGMLLAIVVTLFDNQILGYGVIVAGLATGAALGAWLAITVEMTGMPQMVALLNGFGGAASAVVAGASLLAVNKLTGAEFESLLVSTAVSGLIGAVTLTGSLVAWAKLEGKMTEKSITLPYHQFLNAGLFVLSLILGWGMVQAPGASDWLYWLLCLVAAVLGVTLVIPIGGADMPVVIALLNSYSGMAAAATGFVLNNDVLIIAGSLVGASGIILTQIMCKAMNRSFFNVMFGSMAVGEGPSADDVYAGKIKSASADDVAMVLDSARRVVIVPGYGMAVAQCQHAVRDLTTLLEKRGSTVEFAIHPVAGRMPGHMNVLLAEADIPYEKLFEMDAINPTMSQVDVAIVLGANDVVNPLARTDPKSPIAGMPIIDVDKAKTVIVIKRSLSPGFAGIPNPLFALDNTLMYFADGKKAIMDLITAVNEL